MMEKLPNNCSIEDIQYHLYVLEKVRSVFASVIHGKRNLS